MANPNDLNATINIVTNGGEETSVLTSKNDGRKFNGTKKKGKNSENIHKTNFKSYAKLGLALRQVKLANEVVGSYTNNRLRQRNLDVAYTFTQYGVGLVVAGPIGVVYAGGDLAYRGMNYAIKLDRHNKEARMIRDISGIGARNMSRNNGVKI